MERAGGNAMTQKEALLITSSRFLEKGLHKTKSFIMINT